MMFRWSMLAALLVAASSSVSCVTTYDSAGRPVQTVDPGVAIAGAAAAGIVGYAIANNRNHNYHYSGGGGYYHPHHGSYSCY